MSGVGQLQSMSQCSSVTPGFENRQCDRDLMAYKVENIYHWTLYRESLATMVYISGLGKSDYNWLWILQLDSNRLRKPAL